MPRVKDLTNQRFGSLVVSPFHFVRNGHAYWQCLCDCGNYKYVRGSHLKAGNVTNCGCKKGHKTHCGTGTRLYRIWRNMIDRCSNEKHRQYKDYGGRGIVVCEEWLDSFESFRDWAMANGYKSTLTIDRRENHKGYSPQNCRWATAREQANNTRKTRFITYNGETHSVSEWARKLGIKQSTLNMRINKYGWSVEDALGKEVKKYGS